MAEERLLIVETSGRSAEVAIASGSEIRGRRRLEESRRHARDLAPAVRDLLAEQGWKPRDLDALIVSRGPGSYTGLRVGLISVQTLAYVTGCAVLAVDTFAAIAQQSPPEVQSLVVIADAQQERVYVQRFERGSDGEWQTVSELTVRPIADVLAADAARFSGPGLHLYAKRLEGRTVDPTHWDPRVESLLTLGLARHRRGERDDLYRLEPHYVRPSSAEEQWDRRGSR